MLLSQSPGLCLGFECLCPPMGKLRQQGDKQLLQATQLEPKFRPETMRLLSLFLLIVMACLSTSRPSHTSAQSWGKSSVINDINSVSIINPGQIGRKRLQFLQFL